MKTTTKRPAGGVGAKTMMTKIGGRLAEFTPAAAQICSSFHELLCTPELRPSHEAEPGALEVTVEGKRDRNFESPHDGEADAVREAQAGVIYSLG